MSALAAVRATGGRLWRRVRAAGNTRYCGLCDSNLRRFLPHGDPVREQSVCPVCYSRERHRLAWSFIDDYLGDGRPRAMLHLAPESSVARRLQSREDLFYVRGDLQAREGVRLDVHCMPFADDSFDFVYCSHVLNMVRDDVAALREIGRLLRPGGLALVQVPLSDQAETTEAAPDWSAAQRQAQFRDPWMWRRHGTDVVSRLERSGLRVERIDWAGRFARDEFERRGLIAEDLLLCRPPELEQ